MASDSGLKLTGTRRLPSDCWAGSQRRATSSITTGAPGRPSLGIEITASAERVSSLSTVKACRLGLSSGSEETVAASVRGLRPARGRPNPGVR